MRRAVARPRPEAPPVTMARTSLDFIVLVPGKTPVAKARHCTGRRIARRATRDGELAAEAVGG